MLENHLDFALIEGSVHSEKPKSSVFLDDQLVPVCSRFHPLAGAEDIELDSLKKEHFLMREPNSGTRRACGFQLCAEELSDQADLGEHQYRGTDQCGFDRAWDFDPAETNAGEAASHASDRFVHDPRSGSEASLFVDLS